MNDATPQAGPSRPSQNPSKLKVIQRDSGDLTTTARPPLSDAAILAQSLDRKAQLKRRAEKWADRLMENTINLNTLKTALKYIKYPQMVEIYHERHLNGICSYPTCDNTPKAPYTSAKRYRISITKRSIREEEGNESEGFCSAGCRVRGEWIERELERTGSGVGIELLEEMVGTNPTSEGVTGSKGTTSPRPLDNDKGSTAAASTTERTTTTSSEILTTKTDKELMTSPAATTKIEVAKPPDPMPNLIIYERPFPSAPPQPPSLHPFVSSPSDKSQPSAEVPELPSTTSTTGSRRKPPSSSLLETPKNLTSSILSQSRIIQSQLPLQDDDGDEDEDLPTGAESGLDLDWGGGEELDQLFEEMRLGRDLMEGG